MDEIAEIQRLEEQNFQMTVKALGESYPLAQGIIDLYTLLMELLGQHSDIEKAQTLPQIQFVTDCRYELQQGILSVLRGHLTDSHLFTRRAIEFCAFVTRIQEHPHLTMVWAEAAQDDASYKNYREKFSPSKLFPKDKPDLSKLNDAYDRCSKVSHPSIYDVARHVKYERPEGKVNILFNSFDLVKGDVALLVITFLWTIQIHRQIISVLARVLEDIIKNERDRWDAAMTVFDDRLQSQKEQWKHLSSTHPTP